MKTKTLHITFCHMYINIYSFTT